jgi:hypothetical protein
MAPLLVTDQIAVVVMTVVVPRGDVTLVIRRS